MNSEDFARRLPRIARFDRPIWAYDRLDGGWQLLRYRLFGDTDQLLMQLENQGNESISADWLEKSVQQHHLNTDLLPILQKAASQQLSAIKLADWYKSWENEVFESYCAAAWEDYYRHGGGK